MTLLFQFSFAPTAAGITTRRQRIHASADRQALFNRIAPVYDNLNDVLSLGQHRIWKRMAVDWMQKKGIMCWIFVAEVAIWHFCCPKKLESMDRWVEGDALDLPFFDCQFDAITIGYGLRNVVDKYKAMKEVYRVLKPGSKASILDFNKSIDEFRASIQGWMIDNIVVHIASGYGLSEEYRYLKSSIQEFLTGEELDDRHVSVNKSLSACFPHMITLKTNEEWREEELYFYGYK